jgi:hypothetical protein
MKRVYLAASLLLTLWACGDDASMPAGQDTSGEAERDVGTADCAADDVDVLWDGARTDGDPYDGGPEDSGPADGADGGQDLALDDVSADGASPDAPAADASHDGAPDSSDGGAPDDPELFLGGFFPIGVFGQPEYLLQTWADRGCNTLLEIAQGEDDLSWDAEAQRLGLRVIRPPITSPEDDLGRTDLLAWSLPDEPDVEANNFYCNAAVPTTTP